MYVEFKVGESAVITVNLPDDASTNVTATINGKEYNDAVKNCATNITVSGLTYGNYVADVKYSDDTTHKANATTACIINVRPN